MGKSSKAEDQAERCRRMFSLQEQGGAGSLGLGIRVGRIGHWICLLAGIQDGFGIEAVTVEYSTRTTV